MSLASQQLVMRLEDALGVFVTGALH